MPLGVKDDPPVQPRFKHGDEVMTEFCKFKIVSPICGWRLPAYQDCWYYHARPIMRGQKLKIHIIREDEITHPRIEVSW